MNIAALWPWYTSKIRQGQVVRFARLPDDAPPEAVQEREFVRVHGGPRSHLAIPFTVGDTVLGGIGFGAFRQERDWPDDLVQSLQLVGEIFANALARKRADEESRQLRQQLARVARITMMGELVASIAHEVNQPLCAIVANAQAIQHMLSIGGYLFEDLAEALQDIAQDSRRASAVLERIRGLLKHAPADRVPVNLNELIREMAALTRSEMVRRGITVTIDLAEPLPAVSGDRVALQQVILNLLVNAADAMDHEAPGNRALVVRSTVDGAGAVTVAVQDSGVGLDPRNIPQLFDGLYTTKPGGMGMGLAICRSILDAHHGRIWATPNAGRGATFQFSLDRDKGSGTQTS
jgi:signal transduction histidine kinase